MSSASLAEPPRLLRAVGLQLVAIAIIAVASELPWLHRAPPEPQQQVEKQKSPPPPEKQIRVVKLPPPEKPLEKQLEKAPAKPREKPPEPKVAEKQPDPPKPPPAPPKVQPSPPKPPPKVADIRQPKVNNVHPPVEEVNAVHPPVEEVNAVHPEVNAVHPQPRQVIAVDSNAVKGVRLHVLVPSTPGGLAAHLRNSGGCMVVSRLAPDGAEIMSLVSLAGGTARLDPGQPCGGVPRLLRDESLNFALGDPLGQARAEHPGESGELVLQVLLTPSLSSSAQGALRQHFGAISEEEMDRLASEQGYEITCFAEPSGPVRCQ